MGCQFLLRAVAAFTAGAFFFAPVVTAQEFVGRAGLAPCPWQVPPCPVPPPAAAPEVPPEAPLAPLPAAEPSVEPLAFGATGGGETFAAASSAVGYIDPALPISQVRIRADAAYDDNRPDRAEFFYPQHGPAFPERSISYQEISSYIEYAFRPRFSAFIEVPVMFLNPQINANVSGLSDINLGAKYAILYSNTRILTAQLRVYAPTGQFDVGLGTGHASLEPALLMYQRINPRIAIEGELRDWIPIGPVGGSDFAGNVLRYGIGANYRVYQNSWMTVSPVVECVGWTVLGGKEAVFPTDTAVSAVGNTIVNAKFGIRTQLGKPVGNGILRRADFYAGYGRALTGDVWYKDIMRFEFRLRY